MTQGLVTFEIKMHPNDTEIMYNNYVHVNIMLLASQQESIDLIASFNISASDSNWNWRLEILPEMTVNTQFNLTLPLFDNVRNETNITLGYTGIFTIRMIGSYLIHSRHTIATSHAEFNPDKHSNVNMLYTWTVCNLTLPFIDDTLVLSDNIFAKHGVAEFCIAMWPGTESADFVSIYSGLVKKPINLDLPLEVRYTFELIGSNSQDEAIIKKTIRSNVYKNEGDRAGGSDDFYYADFVKSMQQQCVTWKYK